MSEKNPRRRSGRPRKAENWTAAILAERANHYFEKCDSRTKMVVVKDGVVPIPKPEPYSIEGLCVYLDITRDLFNSWRKQDSELGRRAEKIHLAITANRVTGALDGTQNPSFAQFMLKNNSPEAYREKVEVENTVDERIAGILERSLAQWQVR